MVDQYDGPLTENDKCPSKREIRQVSREHTICSLELCCYKPGDNQKPAERPGTDPPVAPSEGA